jgi:hypothetical protein
MGFLQHDPSWNTFTGCILGTFKTGLWPSLHSSLLCATVPSPLWWSPLLKFCPWEKWSDFGSDAQFSHWLHSALLGILARACQLAGLSLCPLESLEQLSCSTACSNLLDRARALAFWGMQDLAMYRKFRDKQVAAAARGLIGLFR